MREDKVKVLAGAGLLSAAAIWGFAFVYHTVSGTSNLTGHIVYRITGPRRRPYNVGQVQFLLHQIIQHAGGKHTSGRSSFQYQAGTVYFHRVPHFLSKQETIDSINAGTNHGTLLHPAHSYKRDG